MTNPSARAAARLALILCSLTCLAGHLWAQNENETVGFRTNHVFESGHFGENIDILNGGMNLTVPIGQSYQVTSRLGYGLKLSYSSKVWDTSDYMKDGTLKTDEIMPYNESPFGIGFSMHLGRIYVDAQYIEQCDLAVYTSCWTKTWYWVSPDGTPHIIYTEDNERNAPFDPGPPFVRRLTKELTYARVSGPADSYCPIANPVKHNCFLVETPDGLAYTLERQEIPTATPDKSDCIAETVQATSPDTAITPTQRRDSMDYCGWYTTFIEDRSVGTAGTDGTYPNKVKITYDTRSGFKHTIASVVDSSGRTINFSNCEWSQGANGATDQNAITDNKCIPLSMPAPDGDPNYQAQNKHAVATYQVQMPAYAGSTVFNAAKATYRFVYEFDAVHRANPDYQAGVCCDGTCNTLCPLMNGPVLKLVRVDYPQPTSPPDQYGLYFGYSDYGEVACRTLPIKEIAGNACNVSGTYPRFNYYFDYYYYTAAYFNPGHLAKVGVATAGGVPRTGVSRQIIRKDLQMPAGTVAGSWKYDRGNPTSETNPTQVTVTDTFGNDTVYFYYASRKSNDPNNKGTDPEDGVAPEWNDGLNYRTEHYAGTEATRKLIRTELQEYDADKWARDSTGQVRSKENTRVKSEVTQYADQGGAEGVVSRDAWDGQGHWRIEVESGFGVPRPRTTRTDYAMGRCSVTDSLCSSCPSGETCKLFTDATISTTYLPDVLLLKEVSDGVTVLSRTENDARRDGRLKVSISRAAVPGMIGTPRGSPPLDATRQPGDVMTQYTYSSSSGNAMSKTLSTGRTGDPVYTMNYTYVPAPAAGGCPSGECGGYLATKTFAGAQFKSIDRDRDANTGLIIATRDPSPTLQTNYAYDVLGRVTQVSPPGEEPTVINYVSLLETTVTQGALGLSDLDPGADFLFTRYLYDGLGRLVATQKRPADPTKGFACQKTQYDVADKPIYKTEWKYQPAASCIGLPSPSAKACPADCLSTCTASVCCTASGVCLAADPGTEFDYRDPTTGLSDPFGRVQLEIPIDADRSSGDSNRANWPNVTRTVYSGTGSTVTVNTIHGAGVTEVFPSTTQYVKDALGRLTAVDAPYEQRCAISKVLCSTSTACGPSDGVCLDAGGADAYYDYDGLDRLEKVTLSDSLSQSQIRRFAYDALSQPLWADNPESGVVVYKAYDALGNVLSSQDARGNLRKFAYDFAGRPTDQWVRPAGGSADKLLVHNAYDELRGGYYLGRLTSIQSKDEAENLLLTEQRYYSTSSVGGRLDTQIHTFADWPTGSSISTAYSYTQRGQLQSIRYPLEAQANHGALTVTYDYKNGLVTRAWQSGTSTVWGTLSYNAAGGVTIVDMPNGRTQVTYDSRNRPASITGGAWNGTSWTDSTKNYASGQYSYDGAGNIYQIGNNSYGYDAANRLITAHTQYKGTQYQFDEAFTYDIYGNMWQRNLITTATPPPISETEQYTFSTPSTNRIMTRQTNFGGTVGNGVNFDYDASGNVLRAGRSWKTGPTDPLQEDIKRYQYGALNRLLRVQQVGNSTSGDTNLSEVDKFQYDAAGNRIWKIEKDAGTKTYYVRDATGQVLTEFRTPSTSMSSLEWSADYLYLAGRLLSLRENLRMRPPSGLHATQAASGSNYSISLFWDENSEPDRASYKVYRFKEGVDTAYSLIGQVNAGQPAGPSLTDPQTFALNSYVRYYVTAIDQTGFESVASPYLRVMAGDTAGPSAPSGLAAGPGDRTVTLTWTASTGSSGILGYEIQRGLSSTTVAPVTTQLVNGTSYVDLNLTNGTTYHYRVRAKNANGTWGPLNCCDVTGTPTDLTPPSPPKGVSAVSTCGSTGGVESINLTWDANPQVGGYAISYDVLRSTQPVLDGLTPVTSTTATSATDPGPLTAGTTYYYAIRAVHKSGTVVIATSALSKVVAASPRDSSITPKVLMIARSTDGAVTIHWEPANAYILYRKLNATESCSNYVQVASGVAPDYTDRTVSNNAAYDYAVTTVVNGKESSFSRPTLGIPLDRPSNLFQCYTSDPWNTRDSYASTALQWKPPAARFYQPETATTADGTLAYLKGYHLYHYKLCELFSQSSYYDNSPLREFVVDSNRTRDPYLIDKDAGSNRWLIDPRYYVTDETALSPTPTFRAAPGHVYTDVSSPFNDCSGYSETNCVMPKAVYKVYAEGTWLTVESDWPDYFNAQGTDPTTRCTTRLKQPYSQTTLKVCLDVAGNPDFVPSPRNLRATTAGPGSIRLDWKPPIVAAGGPAVAGFYLYARHPGWVGDTVKSPLPFAVLGPNETTKTLTGLARNTFYEFNIAAVDETGRVSGQPNFCEESGADCTSASGCSLSVCSNTHKICNANSACSTYGACSQSPYAACNNSTLPCPTGQTCNPDVCRFEQCQSADGRSCLHDHLACTQSKECANWVNGHCNRSNNPCTCNVSNNTCDPSSPTCPTGEVCVPGDRCFNQSVTALPGAETAQPAPPASLKTVLWTLNDAVTSLLGRDGIKLVWNSVGGAAGYRVYRSTSSVGPFCALLNSSGTVTVPLPIQVSGLCSSDNPDRNVNQDAPSANYSTTSTTYWDQTVASERVYYYRVTTVTASAETPFIAAYQVWGKGLGYDKKTPPPPQGFRAWASQKGNVTDDLARVVLKWCAVPTATAGSADAAPIVNDPVDEYRVYRTGKGIDPNGVPGSYRLLARLSPTCLNSGVRCEIDDAHACVDSSNAPRLDRNGNYTCPIISTPVACNDTTGLRCSIIDRTFACWPMTTEQLVPYQVRYNYKYFVTAVTGTVSQNPFAESMPSNEDQAWLNYCGNPSTPQECPVDTSKPPLPAPINCYERRDPDGNGDYNATPGDGSVCGSEDARLILAPGVDAPSVEICSNAHDPEGVSESMAPHRMIGQGSNQPTPPAPDVVCVDCGGGPPPAPPSPPSRFVFYHLDHLGSPRLELDDSGNLVAEHHYLPFGEERPAQVDPTVSNKAFTGHQRDSENGLDYMVARYYSSSLGRFMAADPGDDTEPENPQSWNKYAYVRNNPLGHTDPTGHYDFPKVEEAAHNISDVGVCFAGTGIAVAVAGVAMDEPQMVAAGVGMAQLGGDASLIADGAAIAANPSNVQNWKTVGADVVGGRVAKAAAPLVGKVVGRVAKLAAKVIVAATDLVASQELSQANVHPTPAPSGQPGASQNNGAAGAPASGGTSGSSGSVDQKIKAYRQRAAQGPVKKK